MKPIPTQYKRVQFRSRLEARWAVFFDRMNIEWEYEPIEVETKSLGRYCPDFMLAGQYIAEVKPVFPTGLEMQKMRSAAAYSLGVILLIGTPGYRCYWMLTLKYGVKDESPILLLPDKFTPVGRLFPTAADWQCASWGLPPDVFPVAYRQAVTDAMAARFDGFDDDRRLITRRYS